MTFECCWPIKIINISFSRVFFREDIVRGKKISVKSNYMCKDLYSPYVCMMAMGRVGKWTFYHWTMRHDFFYPPRKIPDGHEVHDH